MSYVALDDNFPDHPKVAGLSDKSFRLHISVLCRCGRFLTDGEASKGLLVSVRYGSNAAAIKELLDAGLWEREGEGYRVHDYLVYNPSKAQVQAKRDAAKERMVRVRSQSVRANTEGTDPERSPEVPGSFALPRSPSPPLPLSDPEPEIIAVPALAVVPQTEPTPTPKPPSKPRAVPTAPHPVVVAHYSAEFERLRGSKPGFGPREGKAISAILARYGGDVEKCKRVLTNGLSARYGNPQTVLTIANDPDKWLNSQQQAPQSQARRVAKQQDGDWQLPVAHTVEELGF